MKLDNDLVREILLTVEANDESGSVRTKAAGADEIGLE